MFAGFNFILDNYKEELFFLDYIKEGEKIFQNNEAATKPFLDDIIQDDGIIEAARLEDDWFPQVDADIFISHSHMDEKLALGIAGWLYKEHNIVSFIDSCVWGYSDILLKKIDKLYCVNNYNSDGSISTYSYSKRNRTTSHIHSILTQSLHKMINKTECLLFLNTPNSLPLNDVVNGKAIASPWIYSELLFSRMVERKKLSEYRAFLMHGEVFEAVDELKIKYDVSLDHLVDLSSIQLRSILHNASKIDNYAALDHLYSALGLIEGAIYG